MRRILVMLALTLAIGSTSTSAEAKDPTDWKAVQRLKPGTEIQVVTEKETIEGRLMVATDQEVRLEARDRSAAGLRITRTVSRTEVRELYKAGKHLERRIPRGQLLLSSVIGAAVGVGIGAAYDSAHPYSDDPGLGKLMFGTLGFFMGPAATAIGRAIYSATHRQKLIYRTPQVHRVSSTERVRPTEPNEAIGMKSDTPMS
jgi:hypothetical protein